jgi:hypothetical protein
MLTEAVEQPAGVLIVIPGVTMERDGIILRPGATLRNDRMLPDPVLCEQVTVLCTLRYMTVMLW